MLGPIKTVTVYVADQQKAIELYMPAAGVLGRAYQHVTETDAVGDVCRVPRCRWQ